MRISFILPTVNLSGGLRVVAIYATELVARGHEVLLISPPPQDIPFRRNLKSFLFGNGWQSRVSQPASHFDGVGLDHRVLDCWRPPLDTDLPDADVVIATWWETAEWVMALSPSKGAKIYFIQHHEIHPYLPVERCKATYRLPMHKIVIARWLADVMRDEYGDADVDLVPNSVDRSLFFAPPRGKQAVPTVGFLYSPSSYKGVDITCQAIDKIREAMPDLRVISFGSAHPNWSVERAASIEFHYSPPQDSIRDLYAQCDLWMTASRSEGFNLPAMEAMACRTPVVSTRAGWPMESVVTGWNGALVDVDDVQSLSGEAIRILSMNDDDWKEMSSNAYSTSEQGSWAASCDLFEKALIRAQQK